MRGSTGGKTTKLRGEVPQAQPWHSRWTKLRRLLGCLVFMSDSDRRVVISPVAPGELVGGKYRVERMIGAGGMGVVLAAVHEELGQSVALKFILQEGLAGKVSVERFMREARAVARLKSEHVAKVFDVGRHDDRPYMVLELLEGLDLAKANKLQGPLPVADTVEYVLQSCEALIEAHAAGIVHRDLKPQNLFLTKKLNGAPLVKVLDFGIAKAVGPAAANQLVLTDSSAIIGSPLYMAPEQMRSARTADVRSDIWALGVILYELIGGQLPFDGETVTEVCLHVVNDLPVSLLNLRPGLDERLVSIVMRCLEKDPAVRYQNVAQLASALEAHSRSAQHGGPARPWRSFEDTADTGKRDALAEATGPAIAVVKREPDASAAEPLVSDPRVRTDITWGQGSTNRPSQTSTGTRPGALLVVVAGLALAAVGASAFFLGRATPIAVGTSPPVSPPSILRIRETATLPPTVIPLPEIAAPSGSVPLRLPVVTRRGPTPAAKAPLHPPVDTSSKLAEPRPPGTVGPVNGAPILH